LVSGKLLPARQSLARGLHCCIDIRSATLSHIGDLFLRGRVAGLEIASFGWTFPNSTDEMAEAPMMPLEPLQGFFGIFGRRPVFHRLEFFNHVHFFSVPSVVEFLYGCAGAAQALFAILWRDISSRFSTNFSRSRPHFVFVITFSISKNASGSPSFSRSSFRNGCTFPNITNISPLNAGRRNNSSLTAPCSTNEAAIPQYPPTWRSQLFSCVPMAQLTFRKSSALAGQNSAIHQWRAFRISVSRRRS